MTPQEEHENVAGEEGVCKMTLKAGWIFFRNINMSFLYQCPMSNP